ncbi:MAG: hypothetical protein K2P81_11225 [Bacteriovoracaceae bacterium]|nr:hypothetical protein [Bacteriovoracaceae bacterium]
MNRSVVFFCITLVLSSLTLSRFYDWRESKHNELLQRQSEVIKSDVEERLRHYLSGTRGARLVAATFWQQDKVEDREYEAMAKELISNFPEIYGVNELNPEGKIIRVYPRPTNDGALGKTSQNIKFLKESLARKEKYWFSPPFDLFQTNQRGFVCYISLWKKEEFRGWIAIVLTTHQFFNFFTNNQFGENFNIDITDDETNLSYISSLPSSASSEETTQVSHVQEFGRNLTIKIWPKLDSRPLLSHQLTPFAFALLFSLISTLAFYSWTQRSIALKRLESTNQLLRLTVHDTASSLTTIQGYLMIMKDDPSIVPIDRLSRHVGFVVELLEQMKLVQKLTSSKSTWRLEETPLLPLVIEVSEILTERLKAKNILLNYKPEDLAKVSIRINKGLFSLSVLSNLIINAIKFSPEGGIVDVAYEEDEYWHIIKISDQGKGFPKNIKGILAKKETPQSTLGTKGEKGSGFDLLIALEVMDLHYGKLVINETDTPGGVISIMIPKKEV